MSLNDQVSRRKFLKSAGLLLGTAAVPWAANRSANAASSVRLGSTGRVLASDTTLGHAPSTVNDMGRATTL